MAVTAINNAFFAQIPSRRIHKSGLFSVEI